MLKKFSLYCCLMLMASGVYAQQYTLSGYIKDAENGEVLIGSSVFVKEINGGAVSNVYGYYSITLPPGTYNVEYTYIGFDAIKKTIELTGNVRMDIELAASSEQLEEVVITGEAVDENISSNHMSTVELDIQSIKKVPVFAGEVDIIKSIQLLPGVSSVGEGSSGFNVRGGSVGQNLILLDEAPVYQSSHLFGFFSVFNPDAVKDVKLYKGGIPAKYGGRLSSILDIRMKEGNNKKYVVNGGLGTVFSRLSLEGPIKKDKSSFIIAARRSYADVLAKAFTDVLEDGAALYFYDLTAKANFNIDDKNRVFVSGYFGRDVFKFDERQGFDWGNQTATIRWNHLFNSKLFSNYTLFYSNYDYGFAFGENELDKFEWDSRIITYNFKPEFTYFINKNSEINFGGEMLLYRFRPANAVGVSDGDVTNISLDERKSLESALYVSSDQKISDKLSVTYGLRFSFFNYLGDGTVYEYGDALAGERRPLLSTSEVDNWESIQTYGNLEPRASFRYKLSSTSSIKGSYNRMNQYIHLISNTVAATPIDVWQPSTNNIQPQRGDQVAVGYFKNLSNNKYETSAEVYYRWTDNQIDYIDDADIFINEFLESDLLSGIGRAYGLELYVAKKTGRLNGWISYTLGKSELKVDGINFGSDTDDRTGDWYPTRFDQRHNLKITGNYDINSRMSLSANFSYISGTPATFPTSRYVVQGFVVPHNFSNSRNNFRIPDYHRLDVSFTINNVFFGNKGKKNEDSLVFSVYNLYNRRNPFAIYFSQGQDRPLPNEPIQTNANQVSILGSIIPAFSYNFKF
ncbi:MAG: TonB-dependent receptor [Cyclobacteriaceae bacterium]